MNKTGLMILLLLSAVLVLYPQISTLMDVLEQLSRFSSLPTEIVKVRDNTIMQVSGTVVLYVFLYFFLNSHFENQSTQQIAPSTSTENSPVQQTKQMPPVGKSSRKWLIVVGILAFLGIFFWQLLSIPDGGFVYVVEQALLALPFSIIATCIVVVVFYFVFKYVIEIE